MNNRCLLCMSPLHTSSGDYHDACCKSFYGTINPPLLDYSFAEMDSLAKAVVSNHIAVTGVQPKLSLSLIDATLKKAGKKRLTVVGALGGNYIIKPPSAHFIELPANEHLTMKMANLFGIQTVPCGLIRLNSGELTYITKRIDRSDSGDKVHMLDMYQITDAVDKYKGSMERVGKAIAEFSSNTLMDKLRYFEIAIFCFLTGNNDMHLKNFSLIAAHGGWELSPAYDLLNVFMANPKDTEEVALTIEGKKRRLTRKLFDRFAVGLELNAKQIASVYDRFRDNRADAEHMITQSFLTEESQEKYLSIFQSRYTKLGLK